jgi:protein dithiol:quinone oxidoreductase
MTNENTLTPASHNAHKANSRVIFGALAIFCFAAVGVAVGLQLAFDWRPCPWCILQRYAFLLLGIALFVRAGSQHGLISWLSSWLAGSLAGAGATMAAYQLFVLMRTNVSCGRDALSAFLNELPMARWSPVVFEATGNCADAIPLNFPAMAMLGFLIVGGCAVAHHRRAAARPAAP